MTYRDELPAECPPETAWEITQETPVFRVVKTASVGRTDFLSQRTLQPTKDFKDVSECVARGLSVYTKVADAFLLLKLPRFRTSKVCRVSLGAVAGKLLQTFRPSHHSWWPLADFDILSNCQLEPT